MPWRFLFLFLVPGGLFVVDETYLNWSKGPTRWLFAHKKISFLPNASAIPAISLSEREQFAVKAQFAHCGENLLAYFGLLYPGKGVERIFEIAEPTKSHVLIVGGVLREEDLAILPKAQRDPILSYVDSIRRLAESKAWSGRVTMTGFLPAHEVGRLLSAADAVVLPFSSGSRAWNTSLHAAQAQGTFVLTTSSVKRGYLVDENTYYAHPTDVDDMRRALREYVGTKLGPKPAPDHAWKHIRDLHMETYRAQIENSST
jgi:glycosyltransferase involved in cell wall biosynthesis